MQNSLQLLANKDKCLPCHAICKFIIIPKIHRKDLGLDCLLCTCVVFQITYYANAKTIFSQPFNTNCFKIHSDATSGKARGNKFVCNNAIKRR